MPEGKRSVFAFRSPVEIETTKDPPGRMSRAGLLSEPQDDQSSSSSSSSSQTQPLLL